MSSLWIVCGRVNYTNLSRYSSLCEHTYRRHFNHGLALEAVNQRLIEHSGSETGKQIAVVDCTFVEKSGTHTPGLDWFYNGKSGRVEKGLEWSLIGVVDLEQHTSYSLSAHQTPAGVNPLEQGGDTSEEILPSTRVDDYLTHLADCQPYLPERVKHVVADSFYSKQKWVNGVRKLGLHAVGKLRQDANVKYLYTGPARTGPGRKRKYAGKVDWHQLDTHHFHLQQTLADGTQLYSAVVWSVCFACAIHLLYLLKPINSVPHYALLFSTDTELSAHDIYQFYKARFQIEFVFRDARQFTGLADCQSRNSQALDTHVNASLTALNLAKVIWRRTHASDNAPLRFSMASLKRQAFNQHLLERFIDTFDLPPSWIKSHPQYRTLLEYGSLSP